MIESDLLESVTEELKLRLPSGKPVPWVETLVVTPEGEAEPLENVEDDLQRELYLCVTILRFCAVSLNSLPCSATNAHYQLCSLALRS